MTIQPVETEQQFLGNAPAAVEARQHYAPGAHLRKPSWTPVADAELAALARRSMKANQILEIARNEAIKAETTFQEALAVEAKASEEAIAAGEALLDFTKKGTGL